MEGIWPVLVSNATVRKVDGDGGPIVPVMPAIPAMTNAADGHRH